MQIDGTVRKNARLILLEQIIDSNSNAWYRIDPSINPQHFNVRPATVRPDNVWITADPSVLAITTTSFCPSGLPGGTSNGNPVCELRDRNGVNVLARSAMSEASGQGQDLHNDVLAAIMITQINMHLDRGGWYNLSSFQCSNSSDVQTCIRQLSLCPASSQPGITVCEMATTMIDEYCSSSNSANMMQALVNRNLLSSEQASALTGIVAVEGLVREISIHSSRQDEMHEWMRLQYPGAPYQVLSLGSSNRAVVLGTDAISLPPLDFQCGVPQVAAIVGDPNAWTNGSTATATLSAEGRFRCIDAALATRWWYGNPDRTAFVEFPNENAARAYLDLQKSGYLYPGLGE